MLQTIACIAVPQMAPFEFGVICEVFGIDRAEHGGPTFDFHVVAAEPGAIPTKLGFDIVVHEGLAAAETADLVAVPASLIDEPAHPEVLRVIREAVDRGAWVLSVCSGAFTLGRAGVLDGRRATTHWMYTDRMAEMFPDTDVDPDVLFVQDGKVVTGAGTAAGIDAALHIVRTELGAGAANIVARRMVVPPQRDGGQSQFIQTPVVECRSDSFAEVLDWMLEHLDEDLTVDRLARKALMSPRTFARKFRAETGTTPNAWLNRQRLLRAQQLLEETDLTLEEIARETGFGAAAVMRHHFVKVLQTTPTQYRRVFGMRQAG
ncbi:GlxA family transcriptional regulator [Agromyces aurantiacus]|uniref:GlxA family transcriptional regulator n=1 Tax=Agromyces aurantiacus TaxID=165814 RepID=A0ABV9R7M4_9MICO|nr:helix-turn-helix domain-containing protein [Agromyces aurantiacus]MBM7504184.1 transcriptional regulator GlxA family with amidase domain [Agromyces aurantiacus]